MRQLLLRRQKIRGGWTLAVGGFVEAIIRIKCTGPPVHARYLSTSGPLQN
jgi:hypothetical protein